MPDEGVHQAHQPRLMPPRSMISPAKMKNGTASSTKLLVPFTMFCGSASTAGRVGAPEIERGGEHQRETDGQAGEQQSRTAARASHTCRRRPPANGCQTPLVVDGDRDRRRERRAPRPHAERGSVAVRQTRASGVEREQHHAPRQRHDHERGRQRQDRREFAPACAITGSEARPATMAASSTSQVGERERTVAACGGKPVENEADGAVLPAAIGDARRR